MSSLCGASCNECPLKVQCKGCKETCGSPFGGKCIAAEYIKVGGIELFNEFKKKLIEEINMLQIEGMPKLQQLYCLKGSYVNLAYPLPSGKDVTFLKNDDIYLGCQLKNEFSEEIARCFGVVASLGFILVVEYGCNGEAPEIIMFKRR